MAEQKIGKVVHYFPKVNVAALKLEAPLKKGMNVHFKGGTTDFVETVESMQINHEDIEEAKPGDDVGLLVKERVREGDALFLEE